MLRYALPSALLIGALALLGRGSPKLPAAPAPDPGLEDASPLASLHVTPARTATTGAEVMGINDPVSVPRLWIERGLIQPSQEPAELAADAKLAVNLGAHMARGSTPTYPYLDMLSLSKSNWDWTRADLWVSTVQAAGLEPLMMLGPWPGNQTANYTTSYLPSDMNAYSEYVRRVVERYDGDGKDDMPGLKRGVKYWEVDNEPDLHNSRPPRTGKAEGKPPRAAKPENFQTPGEYAKVLVASAKAIRAADPSAKVATAGFFWPRSAEGRAYVTALVAEPGVLDAVDIVSVHCYFEENTLEPVARTLEIMSSAFPGKPIWVTETSVPAKGSPEWQDEDWQAGMVAGIYGAFLAGGADRIFWHTLADPPFLLSKRATMPFATNSLLRAVREDMASGDIRGPGPTNMEDKPAGAVYRRLASFLANTDPKQYAEQPANGGRLLWTGGGWLAFWGEPEAPKGAGPVTDLRTGAVSTASGAVKAPAWIGLAR